MTTSSTHDDDLSALSPSDLAAYQALLLEPSSTDEEAHAFLRRRSIRLPFASIPIYRNFLRRTRRDPAAPPLYTTPTPFDTPEPRVPCSRSREHASPTPCTPPLCTPTPSPNSSNDDPLPPVCTAAQLSSAPQSSFYDAMSRSLSLAQRLLDQHLLTAGPDLSTRDLCSITSAYRSLILNRLNLEKLDATQLEKAKEREKELQEAEARKDPHYLINKARSILHIPPGVTFRYETHEQSMARLDQQIAEAQAQLDSLRQHPQHNEPHPQDPSPSICTPPLCTPTPSPNSSNDDPLPPVCTPAQLFSPANSTAPGPLTTDHPTTDHGPRTTDNPSPAPGPLTTDKKPLTTEQSTTHPELLPAATHDPP